MKEEKDVNEMFRLRELLLPLLMESSEADEVKSSSEADEVKSSSEVDEVKSSSAAYDKKLDEVTA